MNTDTQTLKIAVPSDGALHEPTLMFLRSCGIEVLRPNARRYTANIPSLSNASVLFQRTADITHKVEEGSAEIGIVGLDRFMESKRQNSDTVVLIDDLGFGHCQLVIGIPDSWVDVVSIADLSDLAVEFRQDGRDLRIATKYPRLVGKYLFSVGVNHFSLVPSSGTLEAAPAMGFADLIADISSSGTTMRENRLKQLQGGIVMTSQACLIANKTLLHDDKIKLQVARTLIELIEAHLQSQDFYSVTANIQGKNPEDVASFILEQGELAGLTGPTISKVYTDDSKNWYSVTIIVPKPQLLTAIQRLRLAGGSSVTVLQPNYVFSSECKADSSLN